MDDEIRMMLMFHMENNMKRVMNNMNSHNKQPDLLRMVMVVNEDY
jgi:hypothetical protein